MGLDTIAHPDDRADILAVVGPTEGRPRSRAWRIRHRDGQWVSIEVVAAPRVDGPLAGHTALAIHDVTKWMELEAQLTRQAFHDPLTGLPEPRPVHRPARARARAAPAGHEGHRGPVHRPRRLQERQRLARPCRGRPADRPGRGAPGRDDPAGGHGGSPRRRRVRAAPGRRRREPGRRRRDAGARVARPAVPPDRALAPDGRERRRRPQLGRPAQRHRHAARRRPRDVRGEGRRQGPVPRLRRRRCTRPPTSGCR